VLCFKRPGLKSFPAGLSPPPRCVARQCEDGPFAHVERSKDRWQIRLFGMESWDPRGGF
jgi:hypothetical protein